MKEILIWGVICVVFITASVPVTAGEDLECYQCNVVTQECEDNKADVIKCGNVLTSRCSRQVKKDSSDKSKAVRKCVIPDQVGNVNCPNGYDCFNCNTNLCNANPVTVISSTSTTAKPSSAARPSAWPLLFLPFFIYKVMGYF